MPASQTMGAVSSLLWGCALALVAAGCASNTVATGIGYNSPPPSGFNEPGPPRIVASAGLPADTLRAPLALRAAAVLRAQGWPVVSADSATGVLISDWQYFDPMMVGQPATAPCTRGIALRVTVRPLPRARQAAVLTEEIGISPGVEGTRALGYARLIFRELREQIASAADPSPTWAPSPTDGWVSLAKDLTEGDFRVCGGAGWHGSVDRP